MTEHDRLINAQLRHRAGDPAELLRLQAQRHRRQRLAIAGVLLAGVLIATAIVGAVA